MLAEYTVAPLCHDSGVSAVGKRATNAYYILQLSESLNSTAFTNIFNLSSRLRNFEIGMQICN